MAAASSHPDQISELLVRVEQWKEVRVRVFLCA
jgi:hypothetical protein